MAKPTERLNKAQLLARIVELETELGLAQTSLAQMSRDLDAMHVEQRPSRRYINQNPWRETTPYVRPVRTLPDHFAAAKELAMKTGRAIKVVVGV